MKKFFLSTLLFSTLLTSSLFSQSFVPRDQKRQLGRLISPFGTQMTEEVEQEIEPEYQYYNRFLAKGFLIFFGAGYATEGLFNFSFSQLSTIYSIKTKNIIPPLVLGIEYALLDFLSLGSEFNFFRLNSALMDDLEASLYLFKFRLALHYSFSRLNLYMGGSIGNYFFQIEESPTQYEEVSSGSLTFSIFTGFRIFFFDTLFIYAETAIPFPIVMGGIGFKL